MKIAISTIPAECDPCCDDENCPYHHQPTKQYDITDSNGNTIRLFNIENVRKSACGFHIPDMDGCYYLS